MRWLDRTRLKLYTKAYINNLKNIVHAIDYSTQLREKIAKLNDKYYPPKVTCEKCNNEFFLEQVEVYSTKTGKPRWECPTCTKRQKVMLKCD